MKLKGYLFASLSAISYGLLPLFIIPIKAVNFPLDTTLFYRFFFAALILFALLLFKKVPLRLSAREGFILVILGLLYAFSSDFLFLGYDYLSPGIASTLLFIYPVIVALILSVVFKEKLTKLAMLSLLITFLGILTLSAKDSLVNINFIGLGITLLSALSYAVYIVTVNKANLGSSGLKITFYSLLFTSIYYFFKALLLQQSLVIPTVGVFFNFLLFSLSTTVLSILFLIYAVKLIGSTPTSIMGALEPVVAVAISVTLFNEQFTWSLFFGIVLILLGVLLNIFSGQKNNKERASKG